jgi:hypothetical protein
LLAGLSKALMAHSGRARLSQVAQQIGAGWWLRYLGEDNDKHLRSILPIPIRGSERFVSGLWQPRSGLSPRKNEWLPHRMARRSFASAAQPARHRWFCCPARPRHR